jgi:hypothetical protein
VRSTLARVTLLVVCLALVAMWGYALFFASKEAVNKIGDRTWAARAEGICAAADAELDELERLASADLDRRAELVDTGTDILQQMLDDLVAATPSDEKGRALVPMWVADYRTLLQNRRNYADRLRAGENVPFTEAAVDGVPITERIETFAGDNEMPSCAPPRGSII